MCAKAFTVECQLVLLINPQSTSRSTLDEHFISAKLSQHSINISIDTHWQSVESWSSVSLFRGIVIDRHWMVCLQKLVDSRPRCWSSVDRVSISEVSIKYPLSADWGLIEGIDQGVLIYTWPQMPPEHTIPDVYSLKKKTENVHLFSRHNAIENRIFKHLWKCIVCSLS